MIPPPRAVSVHLTRPDGTTISVGSLSASRGSTGSHLVSTTFRYDQTWLERDNAFALCPMLPLDTSPHTFSSLPLMPGAIEDAGPDAWGKHVIERAVRAEAKQAGTGPQALDDFDLVMLVDDTTRSGALRFSVDGGETFLSPQRGGVPTMVDIRELEAAARKQAVGEADDAEIALLFRSGTSMGGARPNATVAAEDGRLMLAKFSAPTDVGDHEFWEAVTLELAREAGLTVPNSCWIPIDDYRSVLLTERFDRTRTSGRVGYMSAQTALSMAAGEVVTYVDLAEVVARLSTEPETDLAELCRRVAFTLLVNNVDDHMKNHGFLRSCAGWRLAPAFDINPDASRRDVAGTPLAEGMAGDRTIDGLITLADHFGLTRDEGAQAVRKIAEVTRRWRQAAVELAQDPWPEESNFMLPAFENDNLRAALKL
jgi:serine/threonine-protein kinase HipA